MKHTPPKNKKSKESQRTLFLIDLSKEEQENAEKYFKSDFFKDKKIMKTIGATKPELNNLFICDLNNRAIAKLSSHFYLEIVSPNV